MIGEKQASGCITATRIFFLMIWCPILLASEDEYKNTHTELIVPPAVWGVPLGKALVSDNEQAIAELGRHLFFEPRLSANGCVSCSTCHQPEKAFTDGLTTALGIYGDLHPRNTPTLTNIAYAASFAWIDVGIESLEEQAKVPMFNTSPPEMGLLEEQDAVANIKDDINYQQLFKKAFPEEKGSLSLAYVQKSLAAFERTLISYQSPFDRYVYAGEHDALSTSAKRGMQLFHSRKLGCVTCHHSWNFSGPIRTVDEPAADPTFHSTGLLTVNSGERDDHFKTPTLRNVAVTAPYMHDGSLKTLEDVIEHYEQGGGDGVSKSSLLRQFTLEPQQRTDLIAFLNHLTDEEFIQRAMNADPNPGRYFPEYCDRRNTNVVTTFH